MKLPTYIFSISHQIFSATISVLLFSTLINNLLNAQDWQPENGDFLFQDLDCGPLCNAIEEVTQGANGARFSHVGLVVIKNNETMVLEAITEGVVYTPLAAFLTRSADENGKPKVIVGRLTQNFQHLIPDAIDVANKNYLGHAYDTVFNLKNDLYYCSEMLYFIFKAANNNHEIFSLFPMTFKKPGTENFYPQWETYYSSMKVPIPEGEPGLNPGGISQSRFITLVHIYGKPEGWQNP